MRRNRRNNSECEAATDKAAALCSRSACSVRGKSEGESERASKRESESESERGRERERRHERAILRLGAIERHWCFSTVQALLQRARVSCCLASCA